MENKESKSELELIKDLFLNWLKHWYYFVISLVVCGAIGIAYVKFTKPEYQIQSKVILRKDTGGGGGISESSIMRSFGLGQSAGGNVQDEADMMASVGLTKKIIKKLKLNTEYTLLEYAGIWKTELYKNSPIEVSYSEDLPDSLAAFIEFKLDVKNEGTNITMKVNDEKVGSFEVKEFPATIQTSYGEYTFSKTTFCQLYGNSFKLRIVIVGSDIQAQLYQNIYLVESEKKSSDIIHLSMISKNVYKAKEFLTEAVNVYNEDCSDDKETVGNSTVDFINERLLAVTKELETAEQDIETFKKKNNLTDLEIDAAAFVEQNTNLQEKMMEAETQLHIARLLDDFVKDPKNQYNLIPFNLSISDNGIAEVITAYNTELLKRTKIQKSSNEDNPMAVLYNDQINSMRVNLLLSLENVKKGIEVTINDLKKKEKSFNAKIADIPSQEKGYIALKRNQEIQQKIYIYLLQKREETAISTTSVMPRLRVIDKPYALLKVVSPSLSKVLVSVVFLGGILIPIFAIYLSPIIQANRRKKNK